MSTTREARRERLRRVSALPDAQIRIKWGRLAAYILALVSFVGASLTLGYMINTFLSL